MSEAPAKRDGHRNTERFNCPPFFTARISSGSKVEERASVEDLNLSGFKAKTSCAFDEGDKVDVELITTYAPRVKIRARVRWATPPGDDGEAGEIGLSITRVRIIDWFKFVRIVSQIKKEVW